MSLGGCMVGYLKFESAGQGGGGGGQTKQNKGSWTHKQQIQQYPISTQWCTKIQMIVIMDTAKNVVVL